MTSIRAIGIRTNDPLRVEVALSALGEIFTLPTQIDGYGIATFADDSILLTRVPGAPVNKSLADLAGSLKGNTALMQFRAEDELRPPLHQSSNMNLGPFRLRHFSAAVVGGPQDADEANVCREQLLRELPDFLRRSVSGHTEAEVFFFAIVAECYKKIDLDDKYPEPKFIADAISCIGERLKTRRPRMVTFATGHHIVHFSHLMSSAALTIKGLLLETAQERSVAFVESSVVRERLKQFRAAISLGALSNALANDIVLPTGMTLTTFAESSVWALGKDMTVQSI